LARFTLQNSGIVITGASGGLGAAIALACAQRGARLALLSRDVKATLEVARACVKAGSPKAFVHKLDVSKPAQVKSVCAKVEKDLEGPGVLINNAGTHFFSKVEDMQERQLMQVLNTNVLGPLRMIQALLPGMKRRGRGLIVNIGSNLAWRSIPTGGGYSASKAALARLGESLRDELAGTGVRVLDASPGVVLTRLRERAITHKVEARPQNKLPYPRQARETAEEIVKAMENGQSRLLSAAWPVKIWAKILLPWFPETVDRGFSRR